MRGAFAVVALVPLLAACGAKQSNNLDGASAAFSDAGSSRVELKLFSGERQVFVAEGTFDYRHDIGEVEVSAYEDDGEPAPEVFRVIGKTIYTGWTLAGKRRWQKEEEFDPTSAEELIIPFEGGPPPDRVLQLLLETSTRTEVLGTDEIRGVASRRPESRTRWMGTRTPRSSSMPGWTRTSSSGGSCFHRRQATRDSVTRRPLTSSISV
jgi:hypothetical protein